MFQTKGIGQSPSSVERFLVFLKIPHQRSLSAIHICEFKSYLPKVDVGLMLTFQVSTFSLFYRRQRISAALL